ncbi:MAG: cation:dicarboxylase symporter family transporter [Gemmatimonadales bacterium]|nr:cation:dicarboxylase symporter family transporter [Gemmatimonadales bacterium]NIN10867.1 cation:dicarboxylase symporter family transporter [Gemmatimonadales bacterium]NIR02875.1 cation:dicarboxylase symporter family transporter [Gemmatimonadales bacterium]NIS66509.1 cation:dicarboxylase symporter family transporter [Gemmatimonadales bacterium]
MTGPSNVHHRPSMVLEPEELTPKLGLWIRTRLWVQVLIGMVVGIAVGLLVSPSGAALVPQGVADSLAAWFALPGKVFLALIQMVVVVLVLSSIVIGITSSGDPEFLKRVGWRVMLFFVVTTGVAVALGIVLASVARPGQFIDADLLERTLSVAGVEPPAPAGAQPSGETVSIPERIIGLIPTNPFGAVLEHAMLQIVILAIFIGIALIAMPADRAQPLLDLMGSVQELSMTIVSWAMLLAPYAVLGLLAQITIKIGFDAIVGMSAYVGTVLLALALLLLLYLAIVAVLGRHSPMAFLRGIRDVQLLAFSTSSSAAVMPLSMQTAEEKLGTSKALSQFIIPLGATVNMAGTAIYQVVAAVFLTQVFSVELSTSDLFLLAATTVGASIGSPSTPGVGIVILATILTSVGVPASGIALIIGVDRILDMSRTSINVTGDLAACVVMERWIGPRVQPAGVAVAPA